MKADNERIRHRILTLIDTEFSSDAEFERRLGLPEKTVNNWRRGRSSSYMKILNILSEEFKVNVGELLDIPLKRDTSELSDEEIDLLNLYRKTRTIPEKMRHALKETLETTINLYINSTQETRTVRTKAQEKKQP